MVLHVGTNHIGQDDETSILGSFKRIISCIMRKFPNTRVIVSLIPVRQRKHDPLNNNISSINKKLSMCEETCRVSCFSNANITHGYFYDDKHFDTGGLFIFLCNLRFALFGQLPPPPRKGRNRSRR